MQHIGGQLRPICPQVQDWLTNAYETNCLGDQKVGMLQQLVQDENSRGMNFRPINQQGKTQKVELIYFQRPVEDEVVDEQYEDYCSTTNVLETDSLVIDVDQYAQYSFLITNKDIEDFCMAPQANSLIMQGTMDALNAIRQKINRNVITIVAANAGTFYDGDATKVWAPIDSNSNPLPGNEALALMEYARLGCNDRPIVVGQGDMWIYQHLRQIGCCNNYGINLENAGQFYYFDDSMIDQVINNGDQNFIVYAPSKQAKFVTANKNIGANAVQNQIEEMGTFMDPLTGIVFDLTIIRNSCGRKWYANIELNYNVFFRPQNEFKSTDNFYGTNGVLHFTNA